MEIYTVKYSELTKDQFFEILKLRIKIFVVEQNCPYQELDQFDVIANHVYGLIDGKVMAVGRIYQKDDKLYIGRIAIEKEHRKNGYARKLMTYILDYIKLNYCNMKVELSAQEYLIDFYNSLGFKLIGKTYLEDGIPHVKMIYLTNLD